MSKERLFRFKKFRVAHGQSALPVGFDGVLLGAWVDIKGARRILDVGTGSGVIALICAQRCPEALIDGIDIHLPSVQEASANFAGSPWQERLTAELLDFKELRCRRYDLIVSNPPFYSAGVKEVSGNPRMCARHAVEFGPLSLISGSVDLLTDRGEVAGICRAEMESEIMAQASACGLYVRRLCRVVSVHGALPNRILFQAKRRDSNSSKPECEITTLQVRTPEGEYTEEYKYLTHELYLCF